MNSYLKQAAELQAKVDGLTDTQKKEIARIEKAVTNQKDQLQLALEIIDEQLKAKKITSGEARVATVECEVATEEAIEKLHAQIREINPSFVSNAREQVEDVLQRLAWSTVEVSGKAAGKLAQLARPFVQAAVSAYHEAKNAVNEPIAKPERKPSKLDMLRSM